MGQSRESSGSGWERMSRRAFAAVLGGAGAALVGGIPARASRRWCAVDPVVIIDGQAADIFLSSYVEMHLSTTGPAEIVVTIPKGSMGTVVLSDAGFGLQGYAISFVNSPALTRKGDHTPVRVAVKVPARDGSLPVRVTFAPRTTDSSVSDILFGTSAEGLANRWVKLSTG